MQRLFIISMVCFISCTARGQQEGSRIIPGAELIHEYLPLLDGKSIGLTINHSSLVENTHLTDTLTKLKVNVHKVFTPEHGFTGTISDGVEISYKKENNTFELVSLYGKNKKPSEEQLEGIDLMIFDIQDVGTRFYTYISTMHYILEACAESTVPVLVLDRPNPNGSYVDGPVLDTAFQSFVGLHPIPIVHGLTVGELANMINQEGWLANGIRCDLSIIKVQGWDHSTPYSLPVKPSPNLPDDLSISLYPSLCLFEGTIMSVGRGTTFAFQQIGHPQYPDTTFSFIPQSREGAKWPPYEDQLCYGVSFKENSIDYSFTLQHLISSFRKMNREDFFNDYFKFLAGTDLLQKQIDSGMSEEDIRSSWEPSLTTFKNKRVKYLLYKDL